VSDTPDVRGAGFFAWMGIMRNFILRKITTCPHCGQKVAWLRKVGDQVYGSCGCAVFKGEIPPEWESKP
jgi:hypothetical protein